jgi:hypothetical protein
MKTVKYCLKLLLLILGLLPYITFMLLFAIVGNGKYTEEPFFVVLAWVVFLSIPIQWVFYLSNVFRNTTVSKNQKGLWFVLLLFGNIVAFPFYWYLHIWKDTFMTSLEHNDPEIRTEEIKYKRKIAKIALFVVWILSIIFTLTALLIRLFGSRTLWLNNLGLFGYVLLFGLVAFCITDIFKNGSVGKNQRGLWIALLIIGNVFIFPFYWHRHILRSS